MLDQTHGWFIILSALFVGAQVQLFTGLSHLLLHLQLHRLLHTHKTKLNLSKAQKKTFLWHLKTIRDVIDLKWKFYLTQRKFSKSRDCDSGPARPMGWNSVAKAIRMRWQPNLHPTMQLCQTKESCSRNVFGHDRNLASSRLRHENELLCRWIDRHSMGSMWKVSICRIINPPRCDLFLL